MDPTRRHFLRMAGYGLGGAALTSLIEQFQVTTALAQSPPGYRALVCIFLNGGNDGNNMLVPLDSTRYAAYDAVRNGPGLAIPQANLLPLDPAPGNGPFGLHPSLTDLQGLWKQGKLAIVCNAGPLVQPLTREQYQKGGARPFQLFSHSDQINQWQTSRSDSPSASGWGGRTADQFPLAPTGFPMITSVSGTPLFTVGVTTRPLAIAPAPTALNQVLVLSGFGTGADDVARKNALNYLRTIDRGAALVAATSDITQQALDVGAALSVDPSLNTVFPATSLGNQLRQVAKMIKANLTQKALGLTRQIFFTSLGGFDTHQNQVGQVGSQNTLLTQVSRAMKAFYDATIELGVESSVTTFTLSDFGRTFQPAGSGAAVGSDHAWGNHHFLMGGAVLRGFYGVPGSNGTVFPTLRLGGPDDTDTRGRWIPTTSVEQYAATLATWYGLAAADLPKVFPRLGQFKTANLGFMTS